MRQYMEVITSSSNPFIKELKRNIGKTPEDKHGIFMIEGGKMAKEAFLSAAKIDCVLYDAKRYFDEDFLKSLEDSKIRVISVSENVTAYLSDLKTPQGMICFVGTDSVMDEPCDLNQLKGRGVIILERIQDPGNLGTLIRSAEAFGVALVMVVAGASVFNPKTVRSTMGSIFRQKIAEYNTIEDAVRVLKNNGYTVFASSPSLSSVRIDSLNLCDYNKISFVIGNEGEGVSQKCLDLCDGAVSIPMKGSAESLNASVAGSILMWEMAKSLK